MSRARTPLQLHTRLHTRLAPLAAAALLAACGSGPKTLPGDDAPTLASLRDRQVEIAPDEPGALRAAAEADSIAAYREFLAAAPDAPQRPEAMRRLGDLEMDRADRVAAEGQGASEVPDYKAAIERYEAFLKAYPNDPRVDRVLYQLARAQEGGGQLEAALATLTRLVQQHPGTLHAEEAHFRRGEMLFATRQWAAAEAAYRTVLAGAGSGPRSAFTERALYMQGWSLFKMGRTEDALEPFFAVLDLKLGDLPPRLRDEARLEDLTPLTRADRELVDDSFRVLSISLAALQGEASIPARVNSRSREAWQFRVYLALAELYTRQERVKDAADTLAAFVRRQPLHAQAPLMQAQVIDIYANAGFEQQALAAKREHATRYDANSEFRRANPEGWARAQPLVQQHMAELARHHHALAQRARAANPAAPNPDVAEAVRWYDALLTQFPEHAGARPNRFLLAELLFDERRFARSADEFERVAYTDGGPFERAADAGYSALLALAEQHKAQAASAGADAAAQQALQRRSVALAERFAARFPADVRGGAVLVNAAESLFALATPGAGSADGEAAVALARQALQRQPAPERELQRVAWTVIAHQAFEAGRLAEAEQAYAEVLERAGSGDARRAEWVERRAAAVYRQGEAARAAGDWRAAAGHFARVGSVAGLAAASTLRSGAAFDQATALVELKDWAAAASALEAYRRDHPGHALQKDVPPRLALAYLELGRHSLAAREFETIASTATDPALSRSALWQAAELHEKAARAAPAQAAAPVPVVAPRAAATRRGAPARRAPPPPAAPPSLQAVAVAAWERYVQAHPQPLEPAVEARWRLAELQGTDAARRTQWLRAVQQADAAGGDARTPRTRRWGGLATLALAEPQEAAYQRVKLVEPLQRQLKAKKAAMDELLKAYAAASEAGVAEVTTAATYRTAALYADFGQALIKSERPKKLSKLEREQYDVLLEEQAFPFEEKAIELHEANASRTAAGVWDEWVRNSLQALAGFKPVRYAKPERVDAAYTVALEPLQAALVEARARGAQPAPGLLNALGVALRREGRFEDARMAYEEALALDTQAALPHLNLAILHDLFLGDTAKAQPLYQRYAELVPGEAAQVGRWLAELKARKPAAAATAPPAATAAAPTETKR